MGSVRKLVAVCGLTSLLVMSAAPTALAHNDGGEHSAVNVLLSDLSSPKGLAVDPEKNLVVAQGAFGAPGPVLVFDLHGRDRGTVTPVTDPFSITDVAVDRHDGTGWALSPDETGAGHLFHQLADGTIVDVLNLATYQAGDPDPVNQADDPAESNPYGLTVMRNGDALVADAAGNDIIRVTPDGLATTVARLDIEAIATDHLPPDFPGGPFPATISAEAVPTTVTIGPDGAIYVGELKGFPFRPGTSNIWRIEPDAEGAWCTVNEPGPTGGCSLYSSGYTAIQDIAFNKDNGRLYVYELAEGGVLPFEAALDPTSGAEFPPAVLLEVKFKRSGEKRTELAAGELSQPGGVVVVKGKVYVTDAVFTPNGGRLSRVNR